MAFISFGKIDKNLIPIIIGCVFCFCNGLLNNYKGTILFEHIIIMNIIFEISKLFTVIPFIILKIRSKKVHSVDIRNKIANNVLLFHKNNKMAAIRGKWIYICISAIIHFFQSILLAYTLSMRTNFWIWEIEFTALFYYLIFKIKLYKHHYISIILIILSGFIIDLIFENIQDDMTNNMSLVVIRFLREILFSLNDVVDKYILLKKYGSIYEISLFSGIINTILFGIFSILNYYSLKVDDFKQYFNNFKNMEILVAIGYMIIQLGLYLSVLITNKNNTPCHIFIIFIFGRLAYYFDYSPGLIILYIFFILFILFISLIFNEII